MEETVMAPLLGCCECPDLNLWVRTERLRSPRGSGLEGRTNVRVAETWCNTCGALWGVIQVPGPDGAPINDYRRRR